jgi:hypothetical protein
MEAGVVEDPEPLSAVLAATCHLARAGRLRAVSPPAWAAYPPEPAGHGGQRVGAGEAGVPERQVLRDARGGPRRLEQRQPGARSPAAATSSGATATDASSRATASWARASGDQQRIPRQRSRLPEAGALALREPLVTGRLLARRLDVSDRAGLDLATRLVQAGVLREMTGRAAWRAFAIA